MGLLSRQRNVVKPAPEATFQLAKPRHIKPAGERSIEEQMESLSPNELKAVRTLKKRWESQATIPHEFDDAMYLRFARCSPGPEKFNVETAWKVMKKYNGRYLKLNAADLEEQLLTRTLFIPPGLKSRDGHDCFYMRPSRYYPKQMPTSTIIDNLAYCMNVMVEKENPCTEGIGFVANMDDWTFSNFSTSYCLNFMKLLQGRVPVRVRLFLIVNPPSWFGKIWEIMKTMLSKDFQKKVHMIKASELPEFLADGYERFLPNELEGGLANPVEIVNDFIAYRKSMEDISGLVK